MKSVGYYKPLPINDDQALVDLDLPMPALKPRDILVKVEAVSVNPADVKIRASAAPAEGTARILGYDASGTVEATGPKVTMIKKAMRCSMQALSIEQALTVSFTRQMNGSSA
ncbi:MAG: alcohol dehydrogenase catalytic domain-containing protein [Phyllobacterium sp.]|jgi:NADPH:quinone reductase-like Zn-dependent oxidoreductase|uniref:alcohol dehydrogenase catalytic domain-containing protein n=1 Tax=Phyllobacterium sp. TaxID=1871046 RepID=UPI0030F25127